MATKPSISSKLSANVANCLSQMALTRPKHLALAATSCRSKKPEYLRFNFAEIEQASNRLANGLSELGIEQGTRVLLLVPPGYEFVELWFALLKLGAVTILIDPGMGGKNLRQCITEVNPQAVIGIPVIHLLRRLFRKPFNDVEQTVTLGSSRLGCSATFDELLNADDSFSAADVSQDSPAAIVFTTGSTGVPKGVLYTHGIVSGQIEALKALMNVEPDDVGFPAFLPFALYCIAMGTSCVMPKMDPRKPAEADPKHMVELIQTYKPNYAFGSPAFWQPLAEYCSRNLISLPSLHSVAMFGAPVREEVLQTLSEILPPDANSYTPYGATEALPVCSISGEEILRDTAVLRRAGAGVCVGKPLNGITVKIIAISDQAIEQWDDVEELPSGHPGEIVVSGAVVTESYYNREAQTKLAKIHDKGSVWHRMGDVGYLDTQNRLWFCGRKNHRVVCKGKNTLFSVPCELIFNQHPAVARSALVGVGRQTEQRPVICIEKAVAGNSISAQQLKDELRALAKQHPHTEDIDDFLFHSSFPVDFRHNAKIIREKLALWAAKQLGGKLEDSAR